MKAPSIPVDVGLWEAENLFVWATEDQKTLVSSGLDWEVYVNTFKTDKI
ncbi:hypothetical protein [Aquimarina sp. RZ0]|nr:hypothetical protein [Aquimarina sp. RZ0]